MHPFYYILIYCSGFIFTVILLVIINEMHSTVYLDEEEIFMVSLLWLILIPFIILYRIGYFLGEQIARFFDKILY